MEAATAACPAGARVGAASSGRAVLQRRVKDVLRVEERGFSPRPRALYDCHHERSEGSGGGRGVNGSPNCTSQVRFLEAMVHFL